MVIGADGKKDECTVARFVEAGIKPMILNATNCKTITALAKSPYIEQWPGVRIQVFATQVKAGGDVVDALRIRPKSPGAALPELTPTHEKWAGAVESIKGGKITVEGIRKRFGLSEANEAALVKAAGDGAVPNA
jgi:hypothetical protein